MSAAAAEGGHEEHGKPWWYPVAILGSVGLGLMLFFSLSGQSFAQWSGFFATGLTNVSGGFVNSRAGFMMLIQLGIGIAAFIWLIKWAMGNKAHEENLAKLQHELAEAKAKKAKAKPAEAAAAAH